MLYIIILEFNTFYIMFKSCYCELKHDLASAEPCALWLCENKVMASCSWTQHSYNTQYLYMLFEDVILCNYHFQGHILKGFFNILGSGKDGFLKFSKAAWKKNVQEVALTWDSSLLT